MSFPRSAFLVLIVGICLSATMQAQNSSAPTVDNEFVEQQFGSNCRLIGIPSVRGDLDGDGVEDIVIPAHCTSPLMNQGENSYVVIDPYDSFFGYGNPKVTTAFVADDPQRRGFSLLVIHGAGPDAWHATVPKAKFMLVNIPFRDVKLRKMQVKKRPRVAIYVAETGGDSMTSMVYWDGKKYRYDPMGSSME
jgi:hypothetical protein